MKMFIKLYLTTALILIAQFVAAQNYCPCLGYDIDSNLDGICDSLVSNNGILSQNIDSIWVINDLSSNIIEADYFVTQGIELSINRNLINNIFSSNPLNDCYTGNCNQTIIYNESDSIISFLTNPVNQVDSIDLTNAGNGTIVDNINESDDVNMVYIIEISEGQNQQLICKLFIINIFWKSISITLENGTPLDSITNFCDGDQITLIANISNFDPNENLTYSWNYSGNICNTPTCTFEINDQANYIYFDVSNSNGFICADARTEINVSNINIANFDIGTTLPNCLGENTDLNLINFPANPNFTYNSTWYNINDVNNTYTGNTLNIDSSGMYCNDLYIEENGNTTNNCVSTNCVNYNFIEFQNTNFNTNIYLDGIASTTNNSNFCFYDIDSLILTVQSQDSLVSSNWTVLNNNFQSTDESLTVNFQNLQNDTLIEIAFEALDTNGCIYTENFSYMVNAMESIGLFANNENICKGDLLDMFIDFANEYDTFQWYSNINGNALLLDSTLVNPNISVSVYENSFYTIIAEDNGCYLSDSIFINAIDLPQIQFTVENNTFINNNNIILYYCFGDTAFVEVSPVDSNAVYNNYNWINEGNFTPAIQIFTNTLDTGLHTFEINFTDSLTNCSNTDSIKIYIYELPEINMELNNNNTYCVGTALELNADSINSDFNLSWIYEGNVIGGGDSLSFIIPEVSSLEFTLQTIDTNTGCIYQTNSTINTNQIPDIFFIDDNNLFFEDTITLCSNEDTILNLSENFNSYYWFNQYNSVVDTTRFIEVGNGYNGNCYVQVVDSNQCVNTDFVYINSLPSPNVDLESQLYNEDNCNRDTISLFALSVPGYSYNWSWNENYSNDTSITFVFSSSTFVNLAIYDSITGCSGNMGVLVPASPIILNIVQVYPDDGSDKTDGFTDTLCIKSRAIYKMSSDVESYSWSITGDENIISGFLCDVEYGDEFIIVEWNESGTLILDYVKEGCPGNKKVKVVVLDDQKLCGQVMQFGNSNSLIFSDANTDELIASNPNIRYQWFDINCQDTAIYHEIYNFNLISQTILDQIYSIVGTSQITDYELEAIDSIQDLFVLACEYVPAIERIIDCDRDSSYIDFNKYGYYCADYDTSKTKVFGVELILLSDDNLDTLCRNLIFYDPNELIEFRTGNQSIPITEVSDFQLYPSLNDGTFWIESQSIKSNSELLIYDLNGRVILHNKLQALKNNITISEIAIGNYLAVLKNDNVIIGRQKFVVIKK